MAKCIRGGIEYKRHQYKTKYGETKCEACGQVKMSTCEQEFLKAVAAAPCILTEADKDWCMRRINEAIDTVPQTTTTSLFLNWVLGL